MNATFSLSLGESFRRSPGAAALEMKAGATASAETALVESARKRRRVMDEALFFIVTWYCGSILFHISSMSCCPMFESRFVQCKTLFDGGEGLINRYLVGLDG